MSLLAVGLMYYTPYYFLLVPAILAVNIFLLSRILTTRTPSAISARIIKPSIWLVVLFGYLYTIHVIFLVPVALFIALCIAISVGYGIVVYLDVSSSKQPLISNVLQVILLVFSISFASLLLAYWHWPVIAVLILLWLVVFFLAISWLLDFTTKPYLIATVWALMSIELFWIMSRWINLYTLPKTSLLVSQSALVIAALAYGFGGVFYHYKNKTLRRSLLFEYISVTTVVFVALMLLSKWAVAV